MKCTQCDHDLKEEASDDGHQVNYVCPVHGVVWGYIPYRKKKWPYMAKHLMTALLVITGLYYFAIRESYVVGLISLAVGVLNHTGKLYEIFRRIDHKIVTKEATQ